MKKILILSASPQRDKMIDKQIADELTKMGHKVYIKACLREGREATLKIKPDIVIVPPIRNPYSRDMVEVLKSWGCGVITRHTEPSMDWQDWKKLTQPEKLEMLGRWPYVVDMELVWSQDEADILNRRPAKFKAVAAGAFGLDVYFKKDREKYFLSRDKYNKKHYLDPKKKNLLIGSPWGFADHAPDLQIPEMHIFNDDNEWRTLQINMIGTLHKRLGDKWNLVVTTHPGVLAKPYEDAFKQMKIPVDSESTAGELLVNSDALVHAGSCMAIEAHFLGIPAFQFGDVNTKHPKNWWLKPDSPMSQVSTIYRDVGKLADAILKAPRKTNANQKSIKLLEDGRYGKMDGNAIKRAVGFISQVNGKFKFCWPHASRDYNTLLVMKDESGFLGKSMCGICHEPFVRVDERWVTTLLQNLKGTPQQFELLKSMWIGTCPHCSSRFFYPFQQSDIRGDAAVRGGVAIGSNSQKR